MTAQSGGDGSATDVRDTGYDVVDDESATKEERLSTYSDYLRLSGRRKSSVKKELGYLRR